MTECRYTRSKQYAAYTTAFQISTPVRKGNKKIHHETKQKDLQYMIRSQPTSPSRCVGWAGPQNTRSKWAGLERKVNRVGWVIEAHAQASLDLFDASVECGEQIFPCLLGQMLTFPHHLTPCQSTHFPACCQVSSWLKLHDLRAILQLTYYHCWCWNFSLYTVFTDNTPEPDIYL